MKKPFHLISVMMLGGFALLITNKFALAFIKENSLENFWWNFTFAIVANIFILAICSIFVYNEGVKRGTGRLLQPEYLRNGKRFKVIDSSYDVKSGMTYVFLYTGFYHKICKVPYKLPEGTTHLRVVETGTTSQFEPISIVPEAVRVLTP